MGKGRRHRDGMTYLITILVVIAGGRVESVIATCGLGDDDNIVVVSRVAVPSLALVITITSGAISHGEVLSRLDNALITRRADERDIGTRQGFIPVIELLAGVVHLLLSKRSQIVGAQGVVV